MGKAASYRQNPSQPHEYRTLAAMSCKMNAETVDIIKIVNGGYGFARLADGPITLVRQVLPDESVIITIEEAKKNYLFASARQILVEHPARITPPCKYYGRCGGCDLQHCDYPTQVTLKTGIIEDLLERQENGAVRQATELLAGCLPSPAAFAYRQRIRLQVNSRDEPGFYQFRSHDIIAIDECLLAGEATNKTLTALRENVEGRRLCELSTEVELQLNPESGKIVCLFHFSRKPRPADKKLARNLCRKTDLLERIFFTGTDFSITGPITDQERQVNSQQDTVLSVHYADYIGINGRLDLSWEAGGFCQVNLQQNRKLIETVMDFCRMDRDQTLLDLFCGMGNFSIPLAMMAKEVLGIESQGSAIRSAARNAQSNGLTNCSFIKSPVEKACRELARQGRRFDCLLIDPPRQGAPELAALLAAIAIKRLVYVSCDPATLCRDLADLTSEGFNIGRIQPIDMFPQTHHIETVVLLEK